MNLQKFATDLFEKIEQWLDPQFKQLNADLLAAHNSLEELKKQYEDLQASVPEKIDIEQLADTIKERMKIPEPIEYDELEKLVYSDKLTQHIDEQIAKTELKGADGKDGQDGKDGIDGRDGMDIQIMPEIDSAKTYPRGSYAMHNGGLWHSHMQTSGMTGWECIVKGYPQYEIEQIDGRTFSLVVTDSLGVKTQSKFVIPAMIDKGVWQEGLYQKGDTVSRGGSIWTAQKDTETRPGTEQSDWRLSVKKGRDGKDYAPKGTD